MKFCCLCFVLLIIAVSPSVAQEKTPINFGRVSIQDFSLPLNSAIDSNANAVIIADKGSTVFAGNGKGGLSPVFKRQIRIKLINKNAFDLATVRLSLYHRGDGEEKLTELSAVTYNLENGTVVASKFKKEDLFIEKKNKYEQELKFTLPSVKEGSVIEYSYGISSDFISYLHDWEFQYQRYPCLWSEYEIEIPKLLQYSTISQLFHPFYIDKAGEGFAGYTVRENSEYATAESDHLSVRINTIKHRWVMKDIPAFGQTNYIYSATNYIDRLSFQLNKIDYGIEAALNGRDPVNIRNTWQTATAELMVSSSFGAPLTDENAWMNETLNTIVGPAATGQEAAQQIYQYVRDNLTCLGSYGIYLNRTLRDVFNKKSGSAAEINLLLIGLLQKKGFNASPVILSSREYGINSPRYPIMERLNYVVCNFSDGSKSFLLDASDPFLAFGKLPLNCYNGHARIISKNDSSIFLLPASVNTFKNTTVFIQNDDKLGSMSGGFQSVPGFYGSCDIRRQVHKIGLSEYLKSATPTSSGEFRISNKGLDSLTQLNNPVKIHFDLDFLPTGSVLYFTPVIGVGYTENPFPAADRKYPIELDAPIDELYVLNMDIPKGYTIEEMPKSVKLALNGNDGFYEYIIQKEENGIQLRSRIKLTRALYAADEYNTIRDFFAFIMKKQAEQVVFKKQ
jgi:hypothetical protein